MVSTDFQENISDTSEPDGIPHTPESPLLRFSIYIIIMMRPKRVSGSSLAVWIHTRTSRINGGDFVENTKEDISLRCWIRFSRLLE